MDIIGAMNKEREYLSFRAKGEEPYHWVDAVKEFGFESLKDYFDAKRDYEFSQLKFDVVEGGPETAIDEVFKAIEEKKNKVGFINIDYTLVLSGEFADADEAYCEACNIPVFKYYTRGGSSIATSGDLLIGICFEENREFNSAFLLEKIKQVFENYSSATFTVAGNDVLMNGNKILGSAVYSQNGMFVLINYLSFSDKQELIQRICTKHSTKQPGYINFMNRDQFREAVVKWLELQ